MSMQITIIFDTKEDLIRDLKGLLDTFLPPVSVDTVDTSRHMDYIETVGAAPTVLETPVEAADRFGPSHPPAHGVSAVAAPTLPLDLDDIVLQLTSAFHAGDEAVRDRIVSVRNSLGLKYLSDAKIEHAQAFHDLLVELRL